MLAGFGREINFKGENMPNNKDNPQGGSKNSMGNKSDREFEGQGKDKKFSGGPGEESGSSPKGTSSPGNTDDDEMSTAGGREGQFSDKNRDKDSQWSPGSSQASDQ